MSHESQAQSSAFEAHPPGFQQARYPNHPHPHQHYQHQHQQPQPATTTTTTTTSSNPPLSLHIPAAHQIKRGGSPCLSLDQLFNTTDDDLTLPTHGPPQLNHAHLDAEAQLTSAGSDAAQSLFGTSIEPSYHQQHFPSIDADRRSRIDGWTPSQHSLATSLSPGLSASRAREPFGSAAPAGPFTFDSFPGSPDGYSEIASSHDEDFSSAASSNHAEWLQRSLALTNTAYSSSSGLTSPTSCFSLDDEWAATSQAPWFGGPTYHTPSQTRASSPGLGLFRTLSLPESQLSYEPQRRPSLMEEVESSFGYNATGAESSQPGPTQHATATSAQAAPSDYVTSADNNTCSGYSLNPSAIFGAPPEPSNLALPRSPSPSPTQISLPSSNEGPNNGGPNTYEQQADGLWTGLSSVTLEEGQNEVFYGPHLPEVKEEEEEEDVKVSSFVHQLRHRSRLSSMQPSPSTPKMPVEEIPPAKDKDPEWQQGVDLAFNPSASASGPKRHSRGRRATVSVMEAPTKKPPGHTSSKPTAQEIDPVYWESQTTMATKMAAIARRKQGSEARFVCQFCSETFTRAYNLKGHVRAHKGERPFACDHPGCEKAFARHHDLKRHAELHLSQNRFKCNTCKKGFRKIELLKRHYAQEPSCEDPFPTLADSNSELYLAASTPIPSGPSSKGHKKTRSTGSSSVARKLVKPVKLDEDADYNGGF